MSDPAGRERQRMLACAVIALRLAGERVVVAQFDVAQLVRNLRAAGVSWAVIGDALRVSRQAAQQRYGTS